MKVVCDGSMGVPPWQTLYYDCDHNIIGFTGTMANPII